MTADEAIKEAKENIIELAKEDPDDAKIQKLTASKTSLLSSIATIAKDNNIASNYNKNSKKLADSIENSVVTKLNTKKEGIIKEYEENPEEFSYRMKGYIFNIDVFIYFYISRFYMFFN